MNYNTEINKTIVAHSVFWQTMERVASEGVSLFIQIVLARLLLPEDFGSLAIITAITSYLSVFVQSGLATAIIQKSDLDDLDVSTLLFVSLGVAAFFYVILFMFSPVIAAYYQSPVLKWGIRVLSLTLFFGAVNSVQTAILSRKMEFKKLFFRSILAVPIAGIAGIFMAYLGCGVWVLIIQRLVNLVVTIVVMGYSLRFKLSFSWKRAKTIYAFSVKILLAGLISETYETIQTLIIGKRYSSSDLAYYDKAKTYSKYVVTIVNASISSVLLATFSRKQDNKTELKRMVRKTVSLNAFVMFPVLIGIASLSRPIVIFLFTEKWLACVDILAVFCVLRMATCMVSIDMQVYYALGYSEIKMFYEIGLLIVNVAVLIISVHFGIMAIAASAAVISWLSNIIICFVSKRVFYYTLEERWNDMKKPIINSLVMSIVVL